jgi:hypothetical protein
MNGYPVFERPPSPALEPHGITPHLVITDAIEKLLGNFLIRVKKPKDDSAGSKLWA